MSVLQGNVPLLHRKEFQMMTPAPAATAAGAFVIAPDSGNWNNALLISSATVHYMYNHDEDGWMQIPSGALAGTFGAGACGVFQAWSINYTANGGSTTTVTVAAGTHNITGRAVGAKIQFLSAGAASGWESTVTGLINNAGAGTITIQFSGTAPTSILSTHTFRLQTGRFFVMNAGTVAAGIFKVLDVATMVWQASLSTTGLPASWGTDGKMVMAYNHGEDFSEGTASSSTGTTLTDSTKAWGTNQFYNYEVRITGGTGIGQYRTISSNTSTQITVTSAWTTNPDATSTYEIQANSDYIYLLGNNAVTMYRYSISANTWTTLAPTTARSAAPGLGMSANAIGKTGDPNWANESALMDGRYIYSLRGGAGGIIDRYDIAGGTAGAGAWAVVNTISTETFTTGSSAFPMGEFLYIRQSATNRIYKYSVVDNAIRPFATNTYTDGTAVLGHKIWVKNYDQNQSVKWLYTLQNTGTALHRVMIY